MSGWAEREPGFSRQVDQALQESRAARARQVFKASQATQDYWIGQAPQVLEASKASSVTQAPVGSGVPQTFGGAVLRKAPSKLPQVCLPFRAWWVLMLDLYPGIDSRLSSRDMAGLAFSAGYDYAMKQKSRAAKRRKQRSLK